MSGIVSRGMYGCAGPVLLDSGIRRRRPARPPQGTPGTASAGPPRLAVQACERQRQQARVEARAQLSHVDALADDHDLLHAVAVTCTPLGLPFGAVVVGHVPPLARDGGPPHPLQPDVAHAAGLGPLVRDVVVTTDPEVALRAQHVAPRGRVVEERAQLHSVGRVPLSFRASWTAMTSASSPRDTRAGACTAAAESGTPPRSRPGATA